MKQTIAIANQKGGVGKSTTALALGAGYILKGYKVLYIDLDPQGNLSYTLGGKTSDYSILEVLNNQGTALQALQRTQGGGDLIPSSPSLSGSDIQLSQTGKEYKLSEAIAPIKGRYDYIIIDTPPSLGILTVNALTACTWAIIPAQADTYSLQGIGQLYNTISTVGQYCNPSLIIKGILLTRHNNRIILSRDMQDMIAEAATQLGTVLFATTIRENVALREAQASRRDIFNYAPKSHAAQDYQALIDELVG